MFSITKIIFPDIAVSFNIVKKDYGKNPIIGKDLLKIRVWLNV